MPSLDANLEDEIKLSWNSSVSGDQQECDKTPGGVDLDTFRHHIIREQALSPRLTAFAVMSVEQNKTTPWKDIDDIDAEGKMSGRSFVGKYVYFGPDCSEAVKFRDSTLKVEQLRRGQLLWVGFIRIEEGVENGTGAWGRREPAQEATAGQWQVGDMIHVLGHHQTNQREDWLNFRENFKKIDRNLGNIRGQREIDPGVHMRF